MPYQLSQVNIQLPACIFMAFIKSCSIDSRNEQSPICEVVYETNKAYFRNLQPNRFLPSSVGKALAWRSRGPGFNPHWGQYLTIFFCSSLCKDLSDNLTETPIVKNSNAPLTVLVLVHSMAFRVFHKHTKLIILALLSTLYCLMFVVFFYISTNWC